MSILKEGTDQAAYLPCPSPPEGWEKDNHYLVYGIPTTQEKLLRLFASPSNPAAGAHSQASQVVKLLRDVAGRGTEHFRVIPCRVEENMERPKKVLRNYPGGDGVLVVALDWSYEPGWSRRGVTEEEMKCLQGYFEGKTSWFKSCSTKDRWPIPDF